MNTWSPSGSDVSSSDAPVGEGSNTPVGDEPRAYQAWDARQPEPSTARTEGGQGSWTEPVSGMVGSSQAATWGVGAAAAGAVGWAAYTWWQRRQERRSRAAQVRRMLKMAGLNPKAMRQLSTEVPAAIGRAAGRAPSPWLSFALLPVALWLQSQGKTGQRASKELLEPLELEDRSTRLARQAAKQFERRGKQWIRDVDPNRDRGWGWWPWLLGLGLFGGLAYYFRKTLTGTATTMASSYTTPQKTRSVREVMTRGVEVVSPDATVADAARRMRDLDVGSLPVCDGRRMIGVITDRDISVRATADGKDPNSTPVRQAMSPEVVWVFEDEPADMAAAIMRQRQIRRLPVLDRQDNLVGIVALGDLATDLGDDHLKGETLEQISQPSRPR